jgi:hypothetical protein
MRTNEYTIGTSALLKKDTKCFLYDRNELNFNWKFYSQMRPISNFPRSESDYNVAYRNAPLLPEHTMLTCVDRGYHATARSYWMVTDPDSEYFGKCVVLGYDYKIPEMPGYAFKGVWARDLVTHSAECDC